MPSNFPSSPKFLKGALVAYQSQFLGKVPNIIVFQYNPESMTRSLSQRTAEPESSETSGAARRDAQRVSGPPTETINLSIHLDAADQLESPDSHPHTVVFGLHPALSALELLLYPSSEQLLLSQVLARAGTAQTNPPDLPIVLFVWGPQRVLPVRLTSFNIRELAYDQLLNPIRAEVDLGMRVMTYMDMDPKSLGYNAYVVHQIQKEVLSRLNLLNSAEQVIGILPF